MGGKGAFYKAKYGGGGKGGGKGSKGGKGGDTTEDDHAGAPSQHNTPWNASRNANSTEQDLVRKLHQIDGRSYPAYRDIEHHAYKFSSGYTLILDRAQTDPFAPPSKMRVLLTPELAGYAFCDLKKRIRRTALADYLVRRFWQKVHQVGLDEVKQSANYHAAKGGELQIEKPSQHVLERTSAVVLEGGAVEVRFQLSLPAHGRTVLGQQCATLMTSTLGSVIMETLPSAAQERAVLLRHLDSVEDQEHLRSSLGPLGLTAFVANGSILPRRGGDDDRVMEGKRGSTTRPVPFRSPPSMEVSVTLPHAGEIKGMGIRPGITLIVGGGFHGKSTLLRAFEVGVYNHVPGDGREFVSALSSAAKVRAEDKRAVCGVDISCFLNNLPMGKRTDVFSTQDASGSTSQASNIMEALEVGSELILIDEDTCATNFMIRDYRMQLLVSKDKEPITPFILKVRQMFEELGTSAICVVGGAGAYLEVADTVIMMDSYEPKDVTAEAKSIVEKIPNNMSATERRQESGERFGRIAHRIPSGRSVTECLGDRSKVMGKGVETLVFGSETVDLSFVEQLVERGQVAAIGDYMQMLAARMDGRTTLKQLLDTVEAEMDADNGCAMDRIKPSWVAPLGTYARPRRLEVAAALNRLRTLDCTQQS